MEEIVNANFTSVPVGCVPITYIPPVYGTGMGDFVRVPFKTFKKGKISKSLPLPLIIASFLQQVQWI